MNFSQRFPEIDLIRGIAMVAIIVIHVAAYFLTNRFVFFVWNSLQFAVVTFIFCSAYLFFKKSDSQKLSSLKYFIKRAQRLLIPYFAYLVVLFILMKLNGEVLSINSVVRYITLTTRSNDLSWLVVLMLTLTPVMLILRIIKNKKFAYLFFVLASFFSALVFLFYTPDVNFKLIMWLPWSLILITTDYFVSNENKSFFFPKFLTASLAVFIATLIIKILAVTSLIQYDNKYPPNLFHLSYGLFITAILYWYAKKIIRFATIHKIFTFFSKYSYSIFFIHILVIYSLINFTGIRTYGVFIFLTTIICVTIFIQYSQTYLEKTFKLALKSPS